MTDKRAIDPVCEMTVDTSNAKFTSIHDGKTYYFCSAGCKTTFDRNPKQFVGADVRGGSQ